MMVLKINSPARGFSGIRLSVIRALTALVNAEVYPWIPAKGSVGASGDPRRWRICRCSCWVKAARWQGSGCLRKRR